MSMGLVMFGVTIAMTIMVFFLRLKEVTTPVSVKKILLPPLFMSTGAFMYIVPQFRLSGIEIIESIILGIFFSLFLIKTSKFIVNNGEIYLKRSKAFMLILVLLVLARTLVKFILSKEIDLGEISGMSFLIAFSMIVPWRISMYVKFQNIVRSSQGLLNK